MELADMSIEQLQMLHRERRSAINQARSEMDQIEVVLHKKIAKRSAILKIKQSGLSDDEVAALIKE